MARKVVYICDKCKQESSLASFVNSYKVEAVYEAELCNKCWKLCRDIMLAASEDFKLLVVKY